MISAIAKQKLKELEQQEDESDDDTSAEIEEMFQELIRETWTPCDDCDYAETSKCNNCRLAFWPN